MPLYRLNQDGTVFQIVQSSFSKERDLQKTIEANMEALLGVRFIASEFTTGDRQHDRIDSLCLNQDGYSTIIEFKE
jgi:RecB family endonuclease NucS